MEKNKPNQPIHNTEDTSSVLTNSIAEDIGKEAVGTAGSAEQSTTQDTAQDTAQGVNPDAVKPMKWEDTPLFSFIGRQGSDKADDREESAKSSTLKRYKQSVNAAYSSADGFSGKGEFVLDGITPPPSPADAASPFDQTYPFKNMPLPYDYAALEPHIDQLTMHLHHDKHLQKYIDMLNAALAAHPRYHGWRLERLLQMSHALPAQIKTAVVNNAGGVYNHFFYFESLSPARQSDAVSPVVPAALSDLIAYTFKNIDEFKAELKKQALSVFGSGYAWLVLNPFGRAEIITTHNQDTPLNKRFYPLLNIDVWEHAYYLKHYNQRDNYVNSWFKVVDWQKVAKRLSEIRLNR